MWITSHYDENILFASSAPPPARVLHAADGWSSNVLDLINFDVNGRIRKQQKWTSKTRTMKVLHGLLAVMHNLGKRNGSAQYEAAHAKMKLTYTYLLAGTVL